MVVNFGPDPIKVEVQGRDTKGQFRAERESVVYAGSSHTEYVYDTQTLQVIELKQTPPPAETTHG